MAEEHTRIPPFFRGAADVLRCWHFYAIALTLLLVGVAIQRTDSDQQSMVCDVYHRYGV
jgi:hypothetical protein